MCKWERFCRNICHIIGSERGVHGAYIYTIQVESIRGPNCLKSRDTAAWNKPEFSPHCCWLNSRRHLFCEFTDGPRGLALSLSLYQAGNGMWPEVHDAAIDWFYPQEVVGLEEYIYWSKTTLNICLQLIIFSWWCKVLTQSFPPPVWYYVSH